mmetsp:Transcript_15861/g.25118  ORF Transcript_15861/g.25118 Transcript_15861/m.25118 type:complete len:213 (-) Transcript_15861:204-842(-)
MSRSSVSSDDRTPSAAFGLQFEPVSQALGCLTRGFGLGFFSGVVCVSRMENMEVPVASSIIRFATTPLPSISMRSCSQSPSTVSALPFEPTSQALGSFQVLGFALALSMNSEYNVLSIASSIIDDATKPKLLMSRCSSSRNASVALSDTSDRPPPTAFVLGSFTISLFVDSSTAFNPCPALCLPSISPCSPPGSPCSPTSSPCSLPASAWSP